MNHANPEQSKNKKKSFTLRVLRIFLTFCITDQGSAHLFEKQFRKYFLRGLFAKVNQDGRL